MYHCEKILTYQERNRNNLFLICYFNYLLILFLSLFFTDAAYNCPKKDGQYEDNNQCDKYYECNDGFATEKLCPDGLVFDPLNRKVNKCDHVFNVECGDRLELRKPRDTDMNLMAQYILLTINYSNLYGSVIYFNIRKYLKQS